MNALNFSFILFDCAYIIPLYIYLVIDKTKTDLKQDPTWTRPAVDPAMVIDPIESGLE